MPAVAVERHEHAVDEHRPTPRRHRLRPVEAFAFVAVCLLLLRPWLAPLFASRAAATWLTIFVSIAVQALPFVALGALLSATITVLVPPSFFAKALPRRPALAVPVAGACGALLPGCECASVPVASALVRKGITPAAAFAFLLSAPAINPVVLVATSVAFPGHPAMVAARFAASLVASVGVGWLWLRFGRADIRTPRRAHLDELPRWEAFVASMRHDLTQAGGFLAIGAFGAATLNVVVPESVLHAAASVPLLSILALGLLAVVLSICSEADAFVAASLTGFSLTARLAFLVVGPMVDLKLFAMQAGTFGRRFATRFAPLTFAVAVCAATATGGLIWGLR
jgi:uncharacterized protein